MIIKLDLEGEQSKQIENLVKEGKYSDLYQFIKIAINNQLQEEKAGISENESIPIGHSIHKATQKAMQDILRSLSDVPLEKSELVPIPEPLIWSFYNRFFPVRVVIQQLAVMVTEKKWLKLSEVQDQAYVLAQMISETLKNYELEHDISRNEKISTGLPISDSELMQYKKKKREDKAVASKLRFQDQFVGRYIKRDSTFKGACFQMRLMGAKIENDECYVSLTELGREFALMKNPIIDDEDYSRAFSDDEVKFIFTKILPQFNLENIIVQRILIELKNKNLTASEIDEIFLQEKKKYFESSKSGMSSKDLSETVVSERVATMGRLSELHIVNWKIDHDGKSVYSIVI